MTDPNPTPVPPVQTMVIERGTGDGGVLPSTSLAGETAKTPGKLPDVFIQAVSPLKNVVIRALRTFIQTVLGILSASMVAPKLLPAGDFLHLLGVAASLSVAATVISVLQNALELLAKMDQTNPVLRG